MRRLLLLTAWIGAAAFAAVLLLPWWLGAALPLVGRAFQLKFNGYERVGYARFQLESFEISRAAVKVRAERVAAETPVLWLWHRWTGRPSAVVTGAWQVEVTGRNRPAATSEVSGWLPLKAKLGLVADRLEFWLPRAETGPGTVRWPGNELTFGQASWTGRTLTEAEVVFGRLRAAATLVIGADHEMQLTVKTADAAGTAELKTTRDTVTGAVTGWGQPAELVAHFGAQGWAPRDATLRASHWEIPGAQVKLGTQYAILRGGGEVTWSDGQLRAELAANGVPLDKSAAPPLAVKLRGHGSAHEWVADALDVQMPGLSAQLTEPLVVDHEGRLHSGESHFALEADLAKLPWFQLKGRVKGDGAISSGVSGEVAVKFSLAGEAVAIGEAAASRVDLQGKLDWPQLAVTRGTLTLANGDAVTVAGNCDLLGKTLDVVEVKGSVRRESVARWLPENLGFEALEIDGHASGAWGAVAHGGQVRVKNLQVVGLKPFDAEAKWRGRGLAVDAVDLTAAAGNTRLAATGSADRDRAQLSALTLTRPDGAQLSLTRPAEIRWRPQLEIKGVHLAGAGATVEGTLMWGDAGQIDLSAAQFDAAWLRDVFPLPATAWTVETLGLQGRWADGPANFTAAGVVTVDLGNARTARISGQAAGGADGIRLDSLRVAEGEGVIVNATGRLPLVVHPRKKPLVEWAGEAPFALEAATAPNPEFWKRLADLTGIEVVSPVATAHLSGTFARPKGELQFRAERVAALPGRFKWRLPKLEALDLHLAGDEHRVTLDRGAVSVDGQALRAEGWLPVTGDWWQEWRTDPVAFLRHGNLRIEIPDAEVAALAPYFPGYLAPQGRLQLDLRFKPNATVGGFLRVKDATSRPLGPLGVLQEVNAELRFDERAVNLVAVTAKMGGHQVTLQGRAELPEQGPPIFDLTLSGTNLPFVRQTGLLLRGDLDLKLKSSANGRAAITGVVGLRDSLFLTDIRSLIPSGQKGSASRPPYFSIEAEPLNRWRLDVRVEGQKFMRLRTPVFNGVASARFQLSGTLGAPQVVGEATVDEGTIRLPFANFAVQQGQVRLTPEQPDPQLYLSSTTRRYGYDVRMELTGPATAPIVTFSSSPPLESEQVLLMVMAGQAPRDEVTTTDRQRVARFGAFFGQSLLGALGGNAEGADRLTISSGENVSAQGRETYSIEYRLNDRWALTGEYDEFDEYYGGVKWRFYQKGGSSADAKK